MFNMYVFTFYNGLKYTKATYAAVILQIGQLITFTLSLVFLDTTLTLVQAIGMLAILAGVILVISFSEFARTFDF